LGFAGCQTFQMFYLKAILWCSVEYWEAGLKCKMMCEKQLDPDTHICICSYMQKYTHAVICLTADSHMQTYRVYRDRLETLWKTMQYNYIYLYICICISIYIHMYTIYIIR
jgi:hypothetical protein